MTEHALIPLVRIDQQRIAELFVGYLKSEQIQAELLQEQESFVVLVLPENSQQAAELFKEFAQQPYHPKYQEAAWQQGDSSKLSSVSGGSDLWRKFTAHAGIVTLTIFALSWLAFIATLLGFTNIVYGSLSFYSQLVWSEVLANPVRLIGPMFIHFSWLHIVFNTMWWWQLGGDIERVYGKGVLINVALISALLSNLGQFIVTGPNFGGLSGVVYAVVGFVWISGVLAPEKGIGLSKAVVGFLMVWLMLGFVDILPVNMANTAHLVGLISGCLLAFIYVKKRA